MAVPFFVLPPALPLCHLGGGEGEETLKQNTCLFVPCCELDCREVCPLSVAKGSPPHSVSSGGTTSGFPPLSTGKALRGGLFAVSGSALALPSPAGLGWAGQCRLALDIASCARSCALNCWLDAWLLFFRSVFLKQMKTNRLLKGGPGAGTKPCLLMLLEGLFFILGLDCLGP